MVIKSLIYLNVIHISTILSVKTKREQDGEERRDEINFPVHNIQPHWEPYINILILTNILLVSVLSILYLLSFLGILVSYTLIVKQLLTFLLQIFFVVALILLVLLLLHWHVFE